MAAEHTIAFRTAGPADIPVIRGLANRIWRSHYPGIITTAQIDYMLERMYAAPVLEDEMARQGFRYLVAFLADEPVGFLAYRFEKQDLSIKVSKLYLVPSRHGQGIGQQMLAAVRNDARRLGVSKILLFVNKNNEKAIRAYERFGFIKAADVVTDIGGGFVMDDYRMELNMRQ